MRELVIISGKGGTGKTSLMAAFAALANRAVLADCDVDAADLHLLLSPKIIRTKPFTGGKRASINNELCAACGLCERMCRFDAISSVQIGKYPINQKYQIDPIRCEGCGVCNWYCHQNAISLTPVINGEWYLSDTRYGPLIHARLGIAEENSGKLVSLIRAQAKIVAKKSGLDLILIDGSPGIGCQVIASITGADLVLIVTEPTVSGLHDLNRVADLVVHFGIPAMVCVNKWDINPQISEEITRQAYRKGLIPSNYIRYDQAVTQAQINKQPVVEYQSSGCVKDIQCVWKHVEQKLNDQAGLSNA